MSLSGRRGRQGEFRGRDRSLPSENWRVATRISSYAILPAPPETGAAPPLRKADV